MAETNQSTTSGQSGDSARLVNALDALFRAHDINTNKMLPAIVVSFDREKNLATVKPLINWVLMSGQSVERHELANVPVISLGGGGFHISFPLKQGDLGWIHAADRDISLFKQNLTASAPNTGRCHRFDDSMFVPDVFRQYSIKSEDADAMVIQSTNGATTISIRGDNIKITAPSQVVIDVPDTTITGNLTVNQSVNILQNLNVAETAIVAGINVNTHGHISSIPGERTAGDMIA